MEAKNMEAKNMEATNHITRIARTFRFVRLSDGVFASERYTIVHDSYDAAYQLFDRLSAHWPVELNDMRKWELIEVSQKKYTTAV